jgi:hypothetical protein
MKYFSFFTAIFLLSFATGCNKNASDSDTPDSVDEDGPMEEAGEWTDEAAEDVGEGMEEAAEETKETAEEIGDDLDGDPETE